MITTKRIGKTIKVSYKGQFIGLYQNHVKYTDVIEDVKRIIGQ